MDLFEFHYSNLLYRDYMDCRDKLREQRQDTETAPHFIISSLEKRWLKRSLEDPAFCSWLDEDTVNKLRDQLKSADPWPKESVIIEKGVTSNSNKKPANWDCLSEIINHNQWAKLDWVERNNNNKICHQKGYPWRLEYNHLINQWRLFWFVIDNSDSYSLFRIPIEDINDVAVLENEHIDVHSKKVENALKKIVQYALLEINPKYNSHRDRIFYILSPFWREASYDEDNSHYQINIAYEKGQEQYVSRLIASLGPWVQLLAPDSLIAELRRIISDAAKRY